MDSSQITKYLYVDSTNRDTTLYPDGNAYTLFLTSPVKNIRRIDLVAASVPNTVYNVTNGTNFILVNETYISILPGYYSAADLATAITSASGNTISIDFLQSQGYYIFSSTDPFTISPQTPEAFKTLGLTGDLTSDAAANSDVYSQDVVYGSFQIAFSNNIVELSTDEIFLDIQELRTTSVLDAKKLVDGTTEGASMRGTFGMIPMDVQGGTIKTFRETSDYKQYIEFDYPIIKIDRLTVRWIDKYGNLINFQGYNHNSFTLRFECIFIKPDPPPPPLLDVEITRIVDALKHAPPPPKPPQETKAWGRWVILVLVISFIVIYFGYVRVIKPLQERIEQALSVKAQPPPMRLY